jgi:hypothetical protein
VIRSSNDGLTLSSAQYNYSATLSPDGHALAVPNVDGISLVNTQDWKTSRRYSIGKRSYTDGATTIHWSLLGIVAWGTGTGKLFIAHPNILAPLCLKTSAEKAIARVYLLAGTQLLAIFEGQEEGIRLYDLKQLFSKFLDEKDLTAQFQTTLRHLREAPSTDQVFGSYLYVRLHLDAKTTPLLERELLEIRKRVESENFEKTIEDLKDESYQVRESALRTLTRIAAVSSEKRAQILERLRTTENPEQHRRLSESLKHWNSGDGRFYRLVSPLLSREGRP